MRCLLLWKSFYNTGRKKKQPLEVTVLNREAMNKTIHSFTYDFCITVEHLLSVRLQAVR